jgi:hypothetical protein
MKAMIINSLTGVSGTGPTQAGGSRDPVFLLAPARSYSTVSIALLAGHPLLYGLPETNLFAGETLGERISAAHRSGVKNGWVQLTGLARAIAQLHEGRQDPAALSRAGEWIRERSAESPKQIMDHLLGLLSPMIGVEKSPLTVGSAQALTTCMRAYPNARYLHLSRHPVGTQRSMLALYDTVLFPPQMTHQERVRRCLLSWYSCHLRIVQALRALPEWQWMRVRAEDLIGQPRTWLPRVLDWLGLDHDEAIISRMLQTERWEFADWDDTAVFGGADPKFLDDPALRPVAPPSHDVIDAGWEISDGARKRIATLARHLGY